MADAPLWQQQPGALGADTNLQSPEIRAFSVHRRRLVLAVLSESSTPMPEADLAHRVADREERSAGHPVDPTRVAVSLVHVHLPVLAAAELVTRSPEGLTVTDRFRSVVDERPLGTLLDAADATPSPAVDRLLALVASPSRRVALEHLTVHGRTSVRDLAAAIVCSWPLTLVTPDRIEQVELELRHGHIPKLVDVGVVERDGDDLRYVGSPFLDEWLLAVGD